MQYIKLDMISMSHHKVCAQGIALLSVASALCVCVLYVCVFAFILHVEVLGFSPANQINLA